MTALASIASAFKAAAPVVCVPSTNSEVLIMRLSMQGTHLEHSTEFQKIDQLLLHGSKAASLR